jgi:CRISP-associated protein Cas1
MASPELVAPDAGAAPTVPPAEDEPLLRVMALHALQYCERLFYLEEVEEIRVADAAVYAGRDLHALLEDGDDGTETHAFQVASELLGVMGKVDAFRRRNGAWTPYEHKRGRCAPGQGGASAAWESDRVQVGAYAMLLEEALGEPVPEGRVRYHASNVTVRVPIDEGLREQVRQTIRRGHELRASTRRPPVASNPRLCLRCSLAPVCLPEEERLAADPEREPLRLFPEDLEGQVLHVTSHSAQVRRSGEMLVVKRKDEPDVKVPIREVQSLVVHGYGQVTTAAIHLCAAHEVPIHWLTGGGRYIAGTTDGGAAVQRRLRQYEALGEPRFALGLARRLVAARIEGQVRFLLRATQAGKGRKDARDAVAGHLVQMREQLRRAHRAATPEELRGHEGLAARAYFAALPELLGPEVDERLRPTGRSRRPPRDRYNAALSFLYTLLFRSVAQAIRAVGLEGAFGFYHTARSASPPLVLDLMELFRVPLCDLPLVGSLNRKQWDAAADFTVARDHVWLSESGRKKAIELFERRLEDVWQHPVLGYSLSYARTVELEVRLLEKEWTGTGGVFARARLR